MSEAQTFWHGARRGFSGTDLFHARSQAPRMPSGISQIKILFPMNHISAQTADTGDRWRRRGKKPPCGGAQTQITASGLDLVASSVLLKLVVAPLFMGSLIARP